MRLNHKPLAAIVMLTAVVVAGDSGQRFDPTVAAQGATLSEKVPTFEVDPAWPPKLPNDWVLGLVSSVSVDRHDNVWVMHRPNTIPEDRRAHAAPPVLEFDSSGKFVQAWGGPGAGFDWPDAEHGISVDYKDNVWIGGASPNTSLTKRFDDMLLRFTSTGKLLLQIGGRDSSGGNKDTKNVHMSADSFVWPKTNETFVADGYANCRVIVFNADTGAFKRLWGAFGNTPIDVPFVSPAAAPKLDTDGPGLPQFSSPVHGIKVSNDGIVYVADRSNRRVQLFTADGKYLTQLFLNRGGPSPNSTAGVAFSPDKDQQFLYIADFGNSHIAVVNRKKLEILYQFGTRSAKPGDFQGLHHLAVDSKGNIYTAEVAPGARAQRFIYKGLSSTLPPNALTPAQLSVDDHLRHDTLDQLEGAQ